MKDKLIPLILNIVIAVQGIEVEDTRLVVAQGHARVHSGSAAGWKIAGK